MLAPLLLALIALAEPAATPPASPELAAMLARARALKLAEEPGWLRLGHWRPRWLPGLKGDPDDPSFYLAPAGQTDPAAELEATLAALLAPPPPAGTEERRDAVCRFPARLAFLSGRLGLDPARFKDRDCREQRAFTELVQARSVTVVFSSYFLDNPASSFGHTFLRLNRTEIPRSGRTQELLDRGVDYSAATEGASAIAYGLKGLFGLFHGTFNNYPYYFKVREYNDSESRDLWEYDLALQPDEVALLVAHLWELTGTWIDYWYLDENCSYHVLGALEAAAPRLRLIEPFAWRPLVVPADTIKALLANPGLVRAVHYRPAIRTQFEARAGGLDEAQAGAVEALARDPEAPLPPGPPAAQAAVLDAATDLVDLRYAKVLVFGTDPARSRARQRLLERRSLVPVVSDDLDLPAPERQRPDAGHGSLRLGLGGGRLDPAGGAAVGFASLDLRLCLHDLLDPPDGYPASAQLEFLPTRLRWNGATGRVELVESDFINVVNLSPWSRFDRHGSWALKLGAARIGDSGCASCVAFVGEGGAGMAGSGFGGALLGALLLDGSVEAASGLDGIGGSGWRVGVGPAALLRFRVGASGALLARGEWRWLPGTTARETWTVAAAGRLHLGTAASLALEWRRQPSEQTLGLMLYLFDRI